jgi:extracellular matrix protein 14
MRLPARTLATLPAVAAILAFSLPTVSCAGIQPSQFEGDARAGSSSHVFPFLKWLRDSAVEVVFGKPSTRTKASKPTAALQSRYRNDVVVRFNVTNSEEEGALAQAAEQMFLDVWAFTPEYVDVRLGKDDVSALLTLLPKSLQPSMLIPDVAAAVWATYRSATSEKLQLESSMADAAKLRTSLDGVGNIFFKDYQTLAVSRAIPRLGMIVHADVPRLSLAGCVSWKPCSHPLQT